jgi:hypothetical protein
MLIGFLFWAKEVAQVTSGRIIRGVTRWIDFVISPLGLMVAGN